MAEGHADVLADAKALGRQRAYEVPIEELNPARASAFRDDAHWAYFERLRAEDPVHYTPDSNYGAFWSITKYNDIVAVDSNHGAFSSASAASTFSQKSLATAQMGRSTWRVGFFISARSISTMMTFAARAQVLKL